MRTITRQNSRRQRAERSQQEGSQQASSGAGEGQASIYITRDEMEAMENSLREIVEEPTGNDADSL